MMRCLLESWNFEVIETSSGPDSVDIAAERHPDLILMDVTLPFDESLKTMSFIKNNLPDKEVPLVVVSGFTHRDIDRCRDLSRSERIPDKTIRF